MNSIEIRERLKEPNAHFNPDEIKFIDEHYLELDYLSIYKSLFTIHYFFREYGLVQEPEYAHEYDDFGIESWEESRLFAIKLIKTGKYTLDELISLISDSFKIPGESILGERKFLILIKNTINLSYQFNIFMSGQTLPNEISALIEKRINTIAYSYLEMVDVFNFIDFANIAFLGRLNEYDSYPYRVWKKYDELNSKDEVSKVLLQIFDEMFGFTPNMEVDNPNYHYFINVCHYNEQLSDKLKGLTLTQRLDLGAQMILDIKEKYPYLGNFYYRFD